MAEIKEYCPSCGREVSAADQFCTNCGYDLRNTKSASYSPNYASGTANDLNQGSAEGEIKNYSSNAVASLVLGIASFFVPYFSLVTAIIAMVLGSKEKSKDSYAKAGFILGIINIVISVIIIVLTISYFAVLARGTIQ
ncbi:MAG: zinc-ribbon domain-containing protein [Bacilli bacterium]